MEHTPVVEHVVSIRRNDPQGPGKPCAFFLDCTCGWGMDYVSTDRQRAMSHALDHSRDASNAPNTNG